MRIYVTIFLKFQKRILSYPSLHFPTFNLQMNCWIFIFAALAALASADDSGSKVN